MKDIQVYTALDAKVKPAERLDILVLSTEGKADMQTFNDLELLKKAFEGKKVAALVDRMFNQDHTLADTLIRRVRMVGIENPQNEGGSIDARLLLANTSCVTSGVYERYFTVDGKRYHHIIDKDTCYPAAYFSSVTVISEDSALADALSTALFCMPLDEGMEILKGLHAEALWILPDGETEYSNGFSEYLE